MDIFLIKYRILEILPEKYCLDLIHKKDNDKQNY